MPWRGLEWRFGFQVNFTKRNRGDSYAIARADCHPTLVQGISRRATNSFPPPATSPATQPASQPLLARPPPAKTLQPSPDHRQPPANQPAAPRPTTTGHDHPDHGHSRPSQSQPNPTRANQPPAPARKPTASLHALPRYSALRDTPCRAWEMLMRKSPIFSRASRMLR